MNNSDKTNLIIDGILKVREILNDGRCQMDQKIKQSIKEQNNVQHIVKPTIQGQIQYLFVPYHSDNVDDTGWGCAWRTIQMIISNQYNCNFLIPSFQWLYSFFSQRIVLEHIYISKYFLQEVPYYIKHARFSPQECSGWAEPFIASLVCYFLGLDSELFLVNSYPNGANAPKQVFEKTVNFQEFCSILKNHFDIHKSAVMIDDSIYAMVIYGIQIDHQQGDPHIFSNRLENQKNIGLYDVTLDLQGNQISNSINEKDKDQYIYKNSYQNINFFNKPWMVALQKTKLNDFILWQSEDLIYK